MPKAVALTPALVETPQIVPQEVMQTINQASQALAGEIQRSLDFYLATSGEQEISKIYISGGSAYLAPLVQAIERRARSTYSSGSVWRSRIAASTVIRPGM